MSEKKTDSGEYPTIFAYHRTENGAYLRATFDEVTDRIKPESYADVIEFGDVLPDGRVEFKYSAAPNDENGLARSLLLPGVRYRTRDETPEKLEGPNGQIKSGTYYTIPLSDKNGEVGTMSLVWGPLLSDSPDAITGFETMEVAFPAPGTNIESADAISDSQMGWHGWMYLWSDGLPVTVREVINSTVTINAIDAILSEKESRNRKTIAPALIDREFVQTLSTVPIQLTDIAMATPGGRSVRVSGYETVNDSIEDRGEDRGEVRSLRLRNKRKKTDFSMVVPVFPNANRDKATKVFDVIMTGIADSLEMNIPATEVKFPFSHFVGKSFYCDQTAAKRGLLNVMPKLAQYECLGSYDFEGKNAVQNLTHLFDYRISSEDRCVYVYPTQNPAAAVFFCSYCANVPTWVFNDLKGEAYRLTYKSFLVLRSSTKNKSSKVSISIPEACEYAGLPSIGEVKQRKYDRDIFDKLRAAVDEINAAEVSAAARKGREPLLTVKATRLSVDYRDAWEHGKITFSFSGEYLEQKQQKREGRAYLVRKAATDHRKKQDEPKPRRRRRLTDEQVTR